MVIVLTPNRRILGFGCYRCHFLPGLDKVEKTETAYGVGRIA